MTNTQRTAWAAGALLFGGAAMAHGRRAARRLDFSGTHVIITGGSRGLGLLVARQLASEGARLTLVARDRAEVERARDELVAAGADVTSVVADVGRQADAERLVEEAAARTGRVDVLINNAGVIKVGPIDHMTRADFDEAMAVHFWGPLHMTLAAVPFMRRQGAGRVVNVSSIGGKIGVPHLTSYCASKFALAGLSHSLRTELAKDNIRVTSVFPGLMRTGSPFNAWFKGRHRDEFAWFAVADSMPGLSMDGRRAAAALIDACRYGDAERIIGWPARLAVFTSAVFPEAVSHAMALANSMILPQANARGGTDAHSGWQSLSSRAPSKLTRMTERAAMENNEVPSRNAW